MKHIKLFEELVDKGVIIRKRSKTKSEADRLHNLIKDSTKELKKIQSECSHPETKLKQSEGSVKKVCTDCGTSVGYASDTELKQQGYS